MHALGQPLNVSQVPPPVTALDVPPLAGATKVPEPVNLIFRVLGLLVLANATPPGLSVFGVVVGLKLMMSQRTKLACPWTAGRPAIMNNNTANDTTALTRIHFDNIFMSVLLAK